MATDETRSTCWASSRNDCSDKLSREHVLSKSLIATGSIKVKGFSWCRDAYEVVGLNSLTKKVLCTRHNNQLSPLDDAGVRAVNAIGALIAQCSGSQSEGTKRADLEADGYALERWILKTVLTISSGEPLLIGGMGEVPGRPPAYLVDVAFSNILFSHKMGLYTLVSEGSGALSDSEIVLLPITKDGMIGAWYVSIYSIDFVLSLFPLRHDVEPPASLRSIGLTESPDLPARALDGRWLYRIPKISASRGGVISHALTFDWRKSRSPG